MSNVFDDEDELDAELELDDGENQERERISEEIVSHLESKRLHDLLECTLDSFSTDEFGSGACLYHAFVSVICHKTEFGLAFDVLHPADERHRCPEGVPFGFTVPWDFDRMKVAKAVRKLAGAANDLYESLGIFEVEPDDAILVPDLMPEEVE